MYFSKKTSYYLYSINEENNIEIIKKLLLMFNSGGLIPNKEIMSNRHSSIFHFKMKQDR